MLSLSIFKKTKALPEGSKEKGREARFTSKPYLPEIVTVSNEDELIEVLCNNAWSPSLFSGYRNQNNFISTDFIVLDIDEGMKIAEAESLVESLNITCLCLPSTSHTDENHRFRLIFPLSKNIDDKAIFIATMDKMYEYFPMADKSCRTDMARFFFGAKMVDGFWYESELLTATKPSIESQPNRDSNRAFDSSDKIIVTEDIQDVVVALYGANRERIPESVDYFIKNAHTGLDGHWWLSANKFLFVLGLQGVEYEKVSKVFEFLAPSPLDDKDFYLLDRSHREGIEARDIEL